MLGELPLAWLTSILATILILVFFITSGDSATLVLATMSTDGDVNPKNRTKIIWGVLVSGIALVLLMAGGSEGGANGDHCVCPAVQLGAGADGDRAGTGDTAGLASA